MAAKTFQENTATSGKYLWSTDANWGGTKPVAGDTVTIPAGTTCTLDVNIALGTGSGTAMTVNGTLDLPSTSSAGTYGFTLTGNVAGTGTISAGTSGTALPNNVIYDIEFSGAFGFTGVLNFQLFCTHPANKIIYLSGAEAIGQTELSVDTNVTGDIWAAGDLIRIDDINGKDSELRTIAAGGIAAGAITVTAGLTNAKESGAYVIRVTSNIMLRGGTATMIQAYANNSYIRATLLCSSSSYSAVLYASSNYLEFNGVCSSGNAAFYACLNVLMSGIVTGFVSGLSNVRSSILSGSISGCTYGADLVNDCIVSGTITGCTTGIIQSGGVSVTGTINGCTNAVNRCMNVIVTGTIQSCTSGVYFCSTVYGNGATFNNTYDLRQVSNVRLFGCTLSGTENYEYDTAYMLGNVFAESFDHDGVADAYKAWSKGGIITSETDTPPTGYTNYYLHTANWTYVCFRQKEIDVEPGKTITVSGYIKCAPYVDASSYPPRLEIIDAYNDPLVDSGNSALASDQVAVASGLNLDWQAVSVQWTNPDTIARHVFVRMMNRFYMWENFQILELEAPNYPAEEDVKTGVDYGIGDEFTGTLAGGGGGLLQGNKRGNKQ